MYTTPAPEADITALIPELSSWRRTTVRLHPRPGNPREVDSHIGGPMLSVTGFPRPACEEHPMDYGGRLLPRPMNSVAQFFRRDIPEIPYPEGCDLLQLYWCPNDHYSITLTRNTGGLPSRLRGLPLRMKNRMPLIIPSSALQ